MRTRKRKYGEGKIVPRGKKGVYYLYYNVNRTGKNKVVGVSLQTTDEQEAHILADQHLKKVKEEALIERVFRHPTPFTFSKVRPQLTREERLQAATSPPNVPIDVAIEKERQFQRDNEEVDAWLNDVKERDKQLSDLNRTNPHLEDMWAKTEEWLKINHRQNTITSYRSVWKKFRRLVDIDRIQELTPKQVTRFVKMCAAEDISEATCSGYIKQMGNIISAAFRVCRYQGENVFRTDQFNKRQKKSSAVQFLTLTQRETLLKVAKAKSEPTYIFIALCVLAGLRPTEAVNQRWEEIDFENKLLHVRNKDADQDIQKFLIKDTDERTIPLRDDLALILTPYRQPKGYIYNNPNSPNMKRFNFCASQKTPYYSLLDEAKIPRSITPHKLRHTFGSLLAQSNVSIYKIAEWLGHSDVNVTTKYYAHLQAYDNDVNRDTK